jgi:hypothetical protein
MCPTSHLTQNGLASIVAPLEGRAVEVINETIGKAKVFYFSRRVLGPGYGSGGLFCLAPNHVDPAACADLRENSSVGMSMFSTASNVLRLQRRDAAKALCLLKPQ